jgi:hypothetical protein
VVAQEGEGRIERGEAKVSGGIQRVARIQNIRGSFLNILRRYIGFPSYLEALGETNSTVWLGPR